MTETTKTFPLSVLRALSPEMAKNLDEAFSLERIGALELGYEKDPSSHSGRRVMQLAGRAAALLLVTVVAVSLTLTALVLMQL